MSYSHYERLSAVDAAFLTFEDHDVHMHVGAVGLFESEPLRRPDGALDIERIRAFVEAALHDSPRFRQKLAWIPFFDHPVWVDDARFNPTYHIRHTALPPPGEIRQLKRLAGRILSQKLDRGKPMWEMWVIEGLAEDRFALIVKAHHCMVDGIAGVDLLAAILRLDPEAPRPEPRGFIPRPEPTPRQLLRDEALHRASLPFSILRGAPSALPHPLDTFDRVRESALGLVETITAGLAPTAPTPLNPDLGPYRRFDWAETPIDQVAEIRKHLGGTINDVVLSTVAGAVGRFLRQRGMRPTPETVFRTMVPVSIRTHSQRGVLGNRVVNFLARLPIHETDPKRRLAATSKETQRLKKSRLVRGAETLEEMSDRTFSRIIVNFVQLAASQRAFNMVVTNIPGPPKPVYLLESRMTDIFPVVPLFLNQGLGIALFSYAGRLCWGLNADWDALPDLHDFAEGIGEEFSRLHEAALRVSQEEPQRPSRGRTRPASRKAPRRDSAS